MSLLKWVILLPIFFLSATISHTHLTTMSSDNDYWDFDNNALQAIWAETNYENLEKDIVEVEWLKDEYSSSDTGIVRVTDVNNYLDPTKKDHIQIEVFSESDFAGIKINLIETDKKSGIFEDSISFTINEKSSSENKLLRISNGDVITAKYTDKSLPEYYPREYDIINTATITSKESPKNTDVAVNLNHDTYSWMDKVLITVVAPDFNFDNKLVDEIGSKKEKKITIHTRNQILENYKLLETGADTGIFVGEVTLAGFPHDVDGNVRTGNEKGIDIASTDPTGTGPSDGILPVEKEDGITIIFEIGEILADSAQIQWNIGEIFWDEKIYPTSGEGTIRVIDPDMNLNQNSEDSFEIDVWSDEDLAGLNLTVTETGIRTGIFEGQVFFTNSKESSNDTLRVAEGSTIMAEYEDNTLPHPYGITDEVHITTTSITGTIIPSSERISLSNLEAVNICGIKQETYSVDQQVQIISNMSENQDSWRQSFVYLVLIEDIDKETVSLGQIIGHLEGDQSFSPSVSWVPTETGTYDVTVFVWESMDDPTALAPPLATTITITSDNDNTLQESCPPLEESQNSTTGIFKILPPLERAPASDCKIADIIGYSMNNFSVGQLSHIVCDIVNHQEKIQSFTYVVQIKDEENTTESISWIQGSLHPGQSFSPSVSWVPTEAGTYDVTVFVWESIHNRIILSPPILLENTVVIE